MVCWDYEACPVGSNAWRYRDSGESRVVADESSGRQDQLKSSNRM
jgi:hypothetical protein